MPPLRIGAVRYSNAAPLTRYLPAEQVVSGVPSEVADWLASGRIDVGLVPVIELGRCPGTVALPRWGVAADGRCETVTLFTRVPLREVRSVALDGASRSGAALTRILLEREGCVDVRVVKRSEGSLEDRLRDVDAALLIGDPVLTAEVPEGVTRVDLAADWKRHVGLPFVFACWATAAGRELSPEELGVLDAAAQGGLERLGDVAFEEALRLGVEPERMEVYLRSLHYELQQDDLRGLRAFLDEAHRVGVLNERPRVTFRREERPA